MGILQSAVDVYNKNSGLVGKYIRGKREPLCPVAHIIQKAQLEITIDKDGNFVDAAELPQDDDCRTVIPVTTESAVRSSGIAAHPLCDQLDYISKIGNSEKFKAYFEYLSRWKNSEFTTPKVDAVYRYIDGGSIINDLVSKGILHRNEDGKIENDKIGGTEYGKAMVRWIVLGTGEAERACWKDENLYDAYFKFYSQKISGGKMDYDYISGEYSVPAASHPRGIISNPNGAKLMSSNDNTNFTFRGRFLTGDQAVSISYESSQKANMALKWLVANSGVYIGGRTFLWWTTSEFITPKEFINGRRASFDDDDEDEEETAGTITMRDDFEKYLYGLKQKLPLNERVNIAAFEAATTGRLSLVYYKEISALGFIERIQNWQDTCTYPTNKGVITPPMWKIVNYAYGTPHDKMMKADDKVYRDGIQQLFTCVAEGTTVPVNMVRALYVKASSLQGYGANIQRRILDIAFAVIRKYKNDKVQKEEWTLSLDKNNKDRSYLYGRLLAVYDKMERDTYQRGEERDTNAIKIQSIYAKRPRYGQRILEERIIPYKRRLKDSSKIYYERLIGEITDSFSADDKNINSRLDDTYILGFYHQRNDFYKSKSEENNRETDITDIEE